MTNIVVYLDIDEGKVEIRVDDELLGSGGIPRKLTCSIEEKFFCHGEFYLMSYLRMHERIVPSNELKKYSGLMPNKLDGWDKSAPGWSIANAKTREFGHLAYWFIEKNHCEAYLNKQNEFTSFATNFLKAKSGEPSDRPKNETVSKVTRTAYVAYSKIIDELESLVTNKDGDELALLKFFKETPEAAFLLETDYVNLWREELIQNYGAIDFVFKKSNDRFRIVEIESPTKRIFTMQDEFTAEFQHAASQVDTWIRGVEKSTQFATRRYGEISRDYCDGLVVIGRSEELSNIPRRERWHAKQAACELLTWDHVVEKGRLFAERLSKFSSPAWN
jgi:hypothetical protein